MNGKKADISVIIVSWNVKDFLKKCLQSIYGFTKGVDFEVFVVDNDSKDNTVAMVKSEFPQVNLTANHENLGFGKANNIALNKCIGRYILFLNPDTELMGNSLQAMVRFMDEHSAVDAIGCKLLCSDMSVQYSTRHFPSIFTDLMENLYLDAVFPRSAFFNRYKMGFWAHDRMREIDVPYGACLLVKRTILRDAGYFDERFFMYYDEIDLCYRIKKARGRIYFVPDIEIIHYSSQSYKQIMSQCDRWKARSKLLFFKKCYGWPGIAALIFNLTLNTMIVWSIISIMHYIFKRPRDLDYFKRYVSFMWGEYVKYLKKGKSRC